MTFLRKYNTLTVTGTTAIRIPIIKRGVVDFAVSADWTPQAGDVKIAIDGAAAADVTNLPTAVAMGNAAYWSFVLTAAELTCKSCVVTIADSATKAVEDQCFVVETYGHASAMYQADLSAANLPANVTEISGDATAADNAEAFFDGTGYAGTNNVIPTVTTVTNLTNAPTSGDLTATMKTSVTTAATAATPIVDVGAINTSTAAAARLALSAAVIILGTVDTTNHTPTTTEFESDDITEATTQHYNGRVIIFTSGALIGQATSISNYSLVSGRGHFTVVALTEPPANNDNFIIV